MKVHSTTTYQSAWSQHPQYGRWISPVVGRPNLAKCSYCNKEIKISNGGFYAISSHASGKVHKAMARSLAAPSQISVTGFFASGSTARAAPVAAAGGESDPGTSSTNGSTPVPRVSPVEVKHLSDRAVVLWALKTVNQHMSYRSVDDITELFHAMFPDSQVAAAMSLKRTKLRYSIVYGLAPFFSKKLLTQLLDCPTIVICFDEALNKVAQRGQMDLHAQFWDTATNRVRSSYLTSVFMGRATASDITTAFKSGVNPIPLANIQHISMDGPNVNHKFYNDLKSELNICAGAPALIDTGSCGLHVVSGAFQAGNRIVKWDINAFLRSLYSLFKDTPSRRASFSELSGSQLWPWKFCVVRWVENGAVAERAIKMFPFLKKWFQKLKKPLQNQAFDTVRKAVMEDKLFLAKLHFFHWLACQLESFLTRFQTAIPMFPTLYESLMKLLRSLMGFYIKKEVLAAANGHSKLVQLHDNLTDDQMLTAVEYGFGSRTALADPTVSQLMRVSFKSDCRKFLKAIVSKIIERSPIRHTFVKGASALSPTLLNTSPAICRTRMDTLLMVMIESNRMPSTTADKVKSQFDKFCSDEVIMRRISEVKLKDTRMDDFYASLLSDIEEYAELWTLIKQVLIMSHGNATVEGGFSVNADLLVDNQKEESLVAQRVVYDAVRFSGGPLQVELTPELMKSVAASNRRYRQALEAREINTAKIEEQRKRKQINDADALEQLKKKKKALDADNAAHSRELAKQIREMEESLKQ